ncbi:MAG: hypothetical protein IPG99_16475 [Ignavibacteria bacterium]|nr:hypothetical protein [Ignavibacteria bacterium]
MKSLIEGSYKPAIGKMVPDTVRVYLRRSISPFTIIDSAKALTDSLGYGLYNFSRAKYDSLYYLTVSHRNSIETWSKFSMPFVDDLQYDYNRFGKAFGNNMTKKETCGVSIAEIQ